MILSRSQAYSLYNTVVAHVSMLFVFHIYSVQTLYCILYTLSDNSNPRGKKIKKEKGCVDVFSGKNFKTITSSDFPSEEVKFNSNHFYFNPEFLRVSGAEFSNVAEFNLCPQLAAFSQKHEL